MLRNCRKIGKILRELEANAFGRRRDVEKTLVQYIIVVVQYTIVRFQLEKNSFRRRRPQRSTFGSTFGKTPNAASDVPAIVFRTAGQLGERQTHQIRRIVVRQTPQIRRIVVRTTFSFTPRRCVHRLDDSFTSKHGSI